MDCEWYKAPCTPVSAQDHHAVVGLHLLPQRVVDCLDDVLFGHGPSPSGSDGVTSPPEVSMAPAVADPSPASRPPAPGGSANRWARALSGSGSGAFHASSTSRSTSALVSARIDSIPSSSSTPCSLR